jgi:hypothetical protein
LLLSLATFLSLGLAAIGLWLAIYALGRWLSTLSASRPWWQPLVAAGLLVGLGATLIWLFVGLAFGLDPIAVYKTGMAQHYEIVTAGRSYARWVWYNLYDYAAFVGLPLSILFGIRIYDSARSATCRRGNHVDAAAVATAATILIITLSGTSRGEVARMWLFLLPPVLLAGASFIRRAGKQWFLWFASLQAASLLVFALFLEVVPVLPLAPLERTRQPYLETRAPHEVQVVFGDHIQYMGYDVAPNPAQAGETLNMTLHWRALGEPQQRYKVFIHLLDVEGKLRAQTDGVPLEWMLPTVCWVKDEIIVDPYSIALPIDLTPGAYTPVVGFYEESTWERLPVRATSNGLPSKSLGDRLELDAIRIEGSP